MKRAKYKEKPLSFMEFAESLGYTACMTCGHPDVYRKKMGFSDYHDFGITKDESVHDPDEAVHALELVPDGFAGTNKLLIYTYYNFEKGNDTHVHNE
ncbi:MAG: hypothetical protein LBG83_00330 [Oscillospiraceae bacterium]|jgi:predicted N-acetyltransferase YhbS|nr:hypothetical protein [Oscillospiraceae bacterium]